MLNQLRFIMSLAVFLLGVNGLSGQATLNINKVSSNLETDIINNPEAYHEISILLTDRVDARGMHMDFRKKKTPLQERSRQIITQLQAKAAQTQPPVLNMINQSPALKQGSVASFWITNVIFIQAKAELIAALSQRNDIEWIDKSYPGELDEYFSAPIPEASKHAIGGREPGHDAINATGMWSLGYTGRGRTALIFDTGTDPTHPALQTNYRGNYFPASWSWFDYNNSSSTVPEDCDDHGTHVAGTIVGVDRVNSDTIGVAPNAYWMSCDGLCSPASNQTKYTAIFQWALNPDNDANTSTDMPDVINNSWRHPGFSNECNSFYVSLFNALEAAGIAVVYSAGNSGPGVSTITPPKNINTDTVNVFCVANVNGNFSSLPLANSSSRGPSTCGGNGSLLIKPEVSAPGTSVRSSVPGGGYDLKTGTSMAAPHVSGAILLLKEAFPYLSGTEIKLALYHSATDLGAPGEDNFFGMGMINVVAAYNYLVNKGNTPSPASFANDAGLVNVLLQNETICDSVFTPLLNIRNNGSSDISSLKIGYTLANGDTGSYTWNGLILSGNSQLVVLDATQFDIGSYQVEYEILAVNGGIDSFQIDNFGTGSFNLIGTPLPESINPLDICIGGTGYFSTLSTDTTVSLRWYDAQTGGNELAEGESFLTPNLGISTDYYLGGIYQSKLGLNDNSNGGGFFPPLTGEGLLFDCALPTLIKSVKVYANAAGNRQIFVRNSDGVLIANWVGPLNTGEQRVELNFNIPAGTDYEMVLGVGGSGGLYANLSGFTFPMTFNGFVTIKGSQNSLYNHFYDWEVEMEVPCSRILASANVSVGSALADFSLNSSNDTINISDGSSVYFNNLSSGATTYDWDFGDGNVSNQQSPTHTYYEPGTYTVILWASGNDNCSSASVKEITIEGEWPYAVDIEEDLAQYGAIKVFPNPNSGQFNVDLDLKKSTAIGLKLYDTAGRTIWSKAEESYFKNTVSVNLTDLPDGVYYLSFQIDQQTFVKKILKTK
jgi:subtilisin family serine protease